MNVAITFTAGTQIICPCCGKDVKVTKSGVLANHGYTAGTNYSWTGKNCPASGAKSAHEALSNLRAALQQKLTSTETDIAAGVRIFANRDRAVELTAQIATLDSKLAG